MSELYPILRALKMGEGSGGGGGTFDYTQLSKKPQINSHTLTGNMSSSDLGLQSDVMTGYEEPSATGAIAETDTVLEAMGKLEKKADNNQNNISTEQAKTVGMSEGGSNYITVNGIRVYVSATQPTTQRFGDVWISDKLYVYSGLFADNPLCAIGSNIDTLNLSSGLCTRYIKKIVLDGSENWYLQSINTHGIANINTDYDFLTSISSDRSAISSHFYQTTAPIADVTEPCFSISPTTSTLYLKVLSSVASTPEELKAWLAAQYAAGTPVTFWYILNTATTETITVPTGLTGTESGYLIQDGTPMPTNPIYPTANDVGIWH